MAIYIALGANVFNGKDQQSGSDAQMAGQRFDEALRYIEQGGVMLLGVSALWQSPAWPAGANQPDYINACAQVETDLDARALLALMHACEAHFGRQRGVKNAARTLDLDLLDYNGQILNAPAITLPHPRMCERGFVLMPLSEIAPNWTDPKNKRAIQNWIARLPLDDVAPMTRLS